MGQLIYRTFVVLKTRYRRLHCRRYRRLYRHRRRHRFRHRHRLGRPCLGPGTTNDSVII